MSAPIKMRPWWQILLLIVPTGLYLICLPARAYCNWMDANV